MIMGLILHIGEEKNTYKYVILSIFETLERLRMNLNDNVKVINIKNVL